MNEYVGEINGKKKEIKVIDENTVQLNGKEIKYSLSKISDYSYLLKLENKIYDITTTPFDSGKYGFLIEGHYFEVNISTLLQQKANELLKLKQLSNHHDEVKAPMPGMIIKIKKKQGDLVAMGESVLILEAMKMENDLHSPASGILKEIFVSEGNSVEKNTLLFSIVSG